MLFKGTVICTSATLATNGGFEYFMEEVGVPGNALTMITESPFDFRRNTLVYITDGQQKPYDELQRLLMASKGRALVLFTAYREMLRFYEGVEVSYPKLVQGQGVSRQQLLEEFRNTPNAVLFATRSFWEGVDVKGKQLSSVIIYKIPFPVPSDLLFAKKCERLDEKYGEKASFIRLAVPEACLALKQGFGRLIRSKTDRGLMALLDGRVNTAKYKNFILRAFPKDAYRTQQLDKVEKFFSNA